MSNTNVLLDPRSANSVQFNFKFEISMSAVFHFPSENFGKVLVRAGVVLTGLGVLTLVYAGVNAVVRNKTGRCYLPFCRCNICTHTRVGKR